MAFLESGVKHHNNDTLPARFHNWRETRHAKKETREPLVLKVDGYLRKENTTLARAIQRVCPLTGDEYGTSTTKKRVGQAVATLALPLAIPIETAMRVAVLIEDGRPTGYAGKRIGKENKIVYARKIRSMPIGSDIDNKANMRNAHTCGQNDDPRSTKVGRFIRRTKLDELPQLRQVARGKMALIGVRLEDDTTRNAISKAMQDEIRYKNYCDAYATNGGALFHPASILGISDINERIASNEKYLKEQTPGGDLYYLWRFIAKGKIEKARQRMQAPATTQPIPQTRGS